MKLKFFLSAFPFIKAHPSKPNHCLPFELVSGVVYKYTCGRCNSTYCGETDRYLKVRSVKHIGISPLTFSKTKPSKESAIRDYFLNCNNIPSFEGFTILTNGNDKLVLEIKESLLIKQYRPIFNKNISSTKLFLFENSSLTVSL